MKPHYPIPHPPPEPHQPLRVHKPEHHVPPSSNPPGSIHSRFARFLGRNWARVGYGYHIEPTWLEVNRFYLLAPAGFWLLATAILLVAAARLARTLHDPVSATIITCAVLHAVFVLFLFGNRWSWLYYSAILVCGLAAALPKPRSGESKGRRRGRMLLGLLACLALLGQVGPLAVQRRWKDYRRTDDTSGLYALPADADAWNEIRERARRERVMVFTNTGAAFVVFPELDSSRGWYLLRSTTTPAEIERVRSQLRAADLLVLPDIGLYPNWPEFSEELAAFQPVSEAPSFRLMRRVAK